MAGRQCVECNRVIRPGPGMREYVVRIGRDRKKPRPKWDYYFGPYGIACSLECAAKKDPVEWGDAHAS